MRACAHHTSLCSSRCVPPSSAVQLQTFLVVSETEPSVPVGASARATPTGSGHSRRLLTGRWARPAVVLALVSLLGAACSSGSGSTATTTTTTTSASASSSTNVPGSLAAGTPQTAVGPAGQKLVLSATRALHEGPVFGGPPGSWGVGFVVTNTGSAPVSWNPRSQITFVDSQGGDHNPVAQQSSSFRNSTAFGAPTTIAVGQTLRPILPFSLPTNATPTTAVAAPFGPSGPTLRWTIS